MTSAQSKHGAGLERIVRVSPAWDKRSPDPKKDYGIGSMKIRFILKGDKGATQFVCSTGMFLQHTTARLWSDRTRDYNPFEPRGYDIGYHSPHAQYEGQTPMDCDLMPEGRCYYDGTSLGADNFMPTFLEKGDEAVWAMLEERYADLFGSSLPAPHHA